MRKITTLILLMCLMSTSMFVLAKPVVLKRKPVSQSSGGRDILAIVNAEINTNEITFDISRYTGDVVIEIVDSNNSIVSTTNAYVYGEDTFCFTLAEDSSENYEIYITLEDGTVYVGSFCCE